MGESLCLRQEKGVCGSGEVGEINALHGDNETGAYAHRTSATVARGLSRRDIWISMVIHT